MRRYTFYLSVALLAFGIGSFVVFKFYWTSSSKVEVKETLNRITPIQQNNFTKDSKAEFVCNDEAINFVWETLRTDKNFREDSDSYVKEHKTKNCQEIFDSKTVNLNDDGFDESIIQNNSTMFCGSAGDCRTWIVSKFGGEYRIIFDSPTAESLEGLDVLQKKTSKFSNLKIRLNNGLWEDNIGFFVFDGKQYQIKKCFVDKNSGGNYDDEKPEENLSAIKLDNCL